MRIKDLSCVGIKLHCYQLRVDHAADPSGLTLSNNPFFNPFFNWLNGYFDYALVGDELAEETLQPHWQCICFRKTAYGEKEIRDLRYRIKKADWLDKTRKQPFSLKKSTSPLGLFKYCQKDGTVHTNLPEKLFKEIARLAEKYYIKPRAQVLRECAVETATMKELPPFKYPCGLFKSFYQRIYQAYLDERILSMPRKTELWGLALRHGIISSNDYFQEFYASFNLD